VRSLLSILLLASIALTLNGCGGFEKPEGLSSFDTESPEDKADEKWFNNFYGEKDKTCDDSLWSTNHFCNP
jgi:hypothetical protein